MDLSNTAAIVTGGASGLGAATAAALAARGADVYALDLASQLETAEDFARITYVSCDVTDGDEVARAVAAASASASPLRIVVNCAGIALASRILSRSVPHDLQLFARVVNVNLCGTFNVMTLAASAIAETTPDENGQRGVVVNTSSVAAFDGQVGQVAYAASKGAIAALCLPAARDLGQYGIRVCTIAPGIMDTPMLATVSDEVRARLSEGIPFPSRLGRAEEYAQLALMIIDHDYLNGETIRMDGALRMAPR